MTRGGEALVLPDSAVALARAIDAAFPFHAERSAAGFPRLARRVNDVWGSADPHEGDMRPLREVSRFSAAMLVSYLAATPGGLTLARLKTVVETLGLGGAGHGRAVLIYLRYAGYVEPSPRSGDGRLQFYRVTDRMRAMLRLRLGRELEARAGFDPAIGAMLAALGGEAAFDAFLVAMSETGLAILRDGTVRNNPVDMFSRRNDGMTLLCEMAKQGGEGDVFPPRGPLTYGVADLARRSGASRMQVAHLLGKARSEGLLIAGADGRDRFSDALADGLEKAIVSTSLLLAGAARIALDG